MVHRRPNIRVVALLVYALAVNALVWATGAAARAPLFDGVSCIQSAGGVLDLDQPTPPPARHLHNGCDLACAAIDHLPVPSRIAFAAPPLTTRHVWKLRGPIHTTTALSPYGARGPPKA